MDELITVDLKEKLLTAGIDEILHNGVSGFSLRRVAAACGASCAAPYKHFKNKDEFIKEIIGFVEEKWLLLAKQICDAIEDPKRRITELCVANVRFRITNALYGNGVSEKEGVIAQNIREYCRTEGIEDAQIRIFAVQSLVCGTAALIKSGLYENTPETFDNLRQSVLNEL